MNAKIVGGVVVVVLAAGVVYALTTKKAESPSETSTPTANTSSTVGSEESSSSTSLRAILASGQGKKCTFTDAESNGTLYAGLGKARVDLSSQTGNSYMIIDGNTTYTWQGGQTTGLKLTLDPAKPQASNANQTTGVDTEKQMDYDCGSWNPDPSVLAPPGNITFQDLDSLLEQLPENMR